MTEAEMKAMILETLSQGLQIPFEDAEKWAEIRAWLAGVETGPKLAALPAKEKE